ncbi:ribbon-helix-helix protein, CopG family [Spirulina sp. CCNP1310]|uniref:ribbon-helix-helix protein, CopG family n=1 Tax=Spirulina sp. CCNP1310 TaxID=3110249 RepID=UPI002B215C49|nr:ribbon-helix-helix protein, CopG family [Spirulina sp. CCNP1310]MEA5421272.1 ribbon-helix-helix protein, CopG family [Spirulina sp. CCNP1310]
MGKSKVISTSVSPELAEQIDQVAEIENQSRAAVIRAAIQLMVKMPPSVWSALHHLKTEGTDENMEIISQEIIRIFTHYNYQISLEKMAESIDKKWLDSLKTEEDIWRAAVQLTRNV